MFLRARNEEQKNIRMQEIIAVTRNLYDEIGYDAINYSKIGKHLRFTRVSLYSYFACKEDIFLRIVEKEIEEYVEDAEVTITGEIKDLQEFFKAWSDLKMRHQRMLSLFSITNTMLFRGASPGFIEHFRIKLYELMKRLGACARIARPEFTDLGKARFIELENCYCLALFTVSIEYKEMHKIPIFPNSGFGMRHFEPQYISYLNIIYEGILSLQKQEKTLIEI